MQGTIPVPAPVFKPAPALLSYSVIMGEPVVQTIACTTSQDELPAAEMPLSQPTSLQYLEFQHANLLPTAFGVTSPAAAIPCMKPNHWQQWKDAKYNIHVNSHLTSPTCLNFHHPFWVCQVRGQALQSPSHICRGTQLGLHPGMSSCLARRSHSACFAPSLV